MSEWESLSNDISVHGYTPPKVTNKQLRKERDEAIKDHDATYERLLAVGKERDEARADCEAEHADLLAASKERDAAIEDFRRVEAKLREAYEAIDAYKARAEKAEAALNDEFHVPLSGLAMIRAQLAEAHTRANNAEADAGVYRADLLVLADKVLSAEKVIEQMRVALERIRVHVVEFPSAPLDPFCINTLYEALGEKHPKDKA